MFSKGLSMYRGCHISSLMAKAAIVPVAIGTLAVLGMTGAAIASTISVPVANDLFETPNLSTANPNYTTFWQAGNFPYGWIGSNSGVQYEANDPGAGFPDTTLPAPAQGTQIMWINSGGYAYQDVGSLASNTTYTLTVALGQPTDALSTAGPGEMYLINGTDNTGTVLADSGVLAAPSGGTFEDYSLSYTSGGTASGDLTIMMTSPSGVTQSIWNNVQLTATAVPEPASLGLVALGGLGLLLIGRRRAIRGGA